MPDHLARVSIPLVGDLVNLAPDLGVQKHNERVFIRSRPP